MNLPISYYLKLYSYFLLKIAAFTLISSIYLSTMLYFGIDINFELWYLHAVIIVVLTVAFTKNMQNLKILQINH